MTPEQRAVRRDSLTAARAAVLQELMAKIAGSENKRADDEFTNIKLMKDTTAAQLLKVMDYYGKSLSVNCTFCHAGGGKWDEDTKEEKNTTRVMVELVNSINAGGLSKLRPNRTGQTPKISCMTCHRGNSTPGNAMLP
jgi:Photosynthetic reaction centre cytochrome C subunit